MPCLYQVCYPPIRSTGVKVAASDAAARFPGAQGRFAKIAVLLYHSRSQSRTGCVRLLLCMMR